MKEVDDKKEKEKVRRLRTKNIYRERRNEYRGGKPKDNDNKKDIK